MRTEFTIGSRGSLIGYTPEGKICFPDRAFKNATVGFADVDVTIDKDSYCFVDGSMVDFNKTNPTENDRAAFLRYAASNRFKSVTKYDTPNGVCYAIKFDRIKVEDGNVSKGEYLNEHFVKEVAKYSFEDVVSSLTEKVTIDDVLNNKDISIDHMRDMVGTYNNALTLDGCMIINVDGLLKPFRISDDLRSNIKQSGKALYEHAIDATFGENAKDIIDRLNSTDTGIFRRLDWVEGTIPSMNKNPDAYDLIVEAADMGIFNPIKIGYIQAMEPMIDNFDLLTQFSYEEICSITDAVCKINTDAKNGIDASIAKGKLYK